MNTRQLRHFLALLDLGSLSAAAQATHLSPPALSRSIRALEDVLGVALFDRQDRRLRPTPFARAYEARARRMVADEKEGQRLLALMQAGESGELSFGMGSSLAPLLLSPLVLELMATAPRVRLHSVIETSERLLDHLLAEKMDFFVGDVRVAQDQASLAVQPMHPCSFGWFARAGHPLAGRAALGMADLRAYPLLAGGYFEPSLGRTFSRLYGLSQPIIEHFAFATDDIHTVQALLAGSDAVVPTTDLAMLAALDRGAVVALDVRPALDMDLALGVVRLADRTLAPVAERAFGILQRRFDSAAEQVRRLRGARMAPG